MSRPVPPTQQVAALQTTTRNPGYGLGAVAGSVAVSQGGRIGYLSYLIASLLVLRANVSNSRRPRCFTQLDEFSQDNETAVKERAWREQTGQL